MVWPKLPEIAVEALRADPEFVGNLAGCVHRHIGHGGAAGASVHGQPIVVVRVNESLRHVAMDLNRAVKKLEFLRLQGDCVHAQACTEHECTEHECTEKAQSNDW